MELDVELMKFGQAQFSQRLESVIKFGTKLPKPESGH